MDYDQFANYNFFETAGDVLNIETLSTLRRAGSIVTGDDSDHDHSAVTLHVLSQDCVAEGSPNLCANERNPNSCDS